MVPSPLLYSTCHSAIISSITRVTLLSDTLSAPICMPPLINAYYIMPKFILISLYIYIYIVIYNKPHLSLSLSLSLPNSSIMESTDSSSGSQHPQLPPGFRFHPTDEELVVHYLKRKLASAPLPVTIIAEIDLYKFDPWELPSNYTTTTIYNN